ncbi:MAG: NAD+ synthase [Candidatus Omnitrophica bacterium]|nr:NAD+ synthase [Candidatus Omnitrophota bacterium]
MKVGIAQINPIVGNYEHNAAKIIRMIGEAAERGLDWVIFSELALPGYPVWDLAIRKRFVREGLKHLERIAAATRSKKTVAILGYIDEGPAGARKSYNALGVLSGGKLVHKQYKTLLPTYDVFLEHIFFIPAREQKIYRYKGLAAGMSICEDIWHEGYDLKPTQVLARKGARVIVNISASPYHGRVAEVRDDLIRKRARENGAYLIYVNQVGGQDDLIFDGRSLVAAPTGDILFRGELFREGLYEVSLDLGQKDFRRSARPKLPRRREGLGAADAGEMYQALVLGLGDYVRKNGFKKVVLGLSGGIDSALTAAIACDALGPGAVIGVAMPGEFSSETSLSDARELARNLGIEFRVRTITASYTSFLNEVMRFKQLEGKEPSEHSRISLAMENLQARLRGLSLMYISNDENVLLLSTGNKSEMAMGYCTLYGDMSGGLCVLGDVFKTDVYRLSAYRNSLGPVIPQATLDKAPTAELRPNQKDQDSLPPYEVLDRILYHYIEEELSGADIARKLAGKGIQPALVTDIINRVDHNEYKRRQAAPILRVTRKAWFGRRMPITNHFRS